MQFPRKIWYLAIPLFGTSLGVWVSTESGISATAFLPNIVAIVIGAGMLFFCGYIAATFNRLPKATAATVVALLAATLLSPGLESVHRWIPLGPLKLNVSMAVIPVALFSLLRLQPLWLLCVTFAICVLHLIQPDAGQATCFAMAVLPIFIFRKSLALWVRVIGIAFPAAMAAFTWTRFDPLLPVPHVEEILQLASSLGILGNVLAAVAGLIAFIPMIRSTTLSMSYAMLLLGSFVVTGLGNFPVPLLGAGAAPILGWLFMVSLLAEVRCPKSDHRIT